MTPLPPNFVPIIEKRASFLSTGSKLPSHFMKFCGKWDMQRIADNAQQFAEWLNANYVENKNAVNG